MMRLVPKPTVRTAVLLSCLAAAALSVSWPHAAAGGRADGAGGAPLLAAALAPAVLAGPTIDVDRTDDNAAFAACTVAPNDCTLRGAIISANLNPGTTINVPAGTYQLTLAGNAEQAAATGDLDITASGTAIVGAGAATTIIEQTTNDRVIESNPVPQAVGFVLSISGVTIKGGNRPTGSGGGMLAGGSGASTTLTDCIFDNNRTTGLVAANGGALADSSATGSDTLTITACVFRNNSTATGAGGAIRYSAPGLASPAGTVTITRSLFDNNRALSNSGGAINATVTNANGTYNVSQTAFVNNQANGGTSRGGAIQVGNGTLNVSYSRLVGNTSGSGSGQTIAITGNGSAAVNNNWWGQNSGPAASALFGALASDWLQLRITASPSSIQTGGTSTLTADIYGSSAGGTVAASNLVGLPPFPNPAAIVFNNPPPALGTISGAVTQFVDGQATATYTAGGTAGTDDVTATADNETVRTNITITEPSVPPDITCPGDITANAAPNACDASVSFNVTATGSPAPTITCQIVSTAQVITSPHTFPAGTTAVSCTASNGSGSDDTCTFNVTVNAVVTPAVNAPPDVTVYTGAGATECSAVVSDATLGTATAADTCNGPVTITRTGVPAGNVFPVGTTTVTYTGTDPANNSGTDTQTVTVIDNTPPTVTAPGPSSASADASCQAAIPNVVAGASATDNCTPAGSITIMQSPAAGTPVGLGPHTITITATDAAGNNGTATTTFTVNDTTGPVVTPPPNVTASTSGSSCSAFVSDATLGSATAADNCDGAVAVTRTGVPAGNIFPVGTTTITYSAVDAAGNPSSATQTVTVTDGTPPVITLNGPNPMIVECHTSFVDPGATANDNCDGSFPATASGTVNANTPGIYTITYNATDASGNNATPVTRTVIVQDTTAPTITLSTQTLTLWPPNHQYRTINVSSLVSGVTDGCDTSLGTAGVKILSVSSDEPDDNPSGGDGSTTNDIVIAADCKSVQLRAERDGNLNGRVYTITLIMKDASNNVATATVKVFVPKSGSSGTAVDDGPANTVTGGCP
ncbi:MAG TPA: immunoglobulin-like domain-containing protein [Pyrinomonadaceae bacterium]|jgi:predicted outer membrane repeat protein